MIRLTHAQTDLMQSYNGNFLLFVTTLVDAHPLCLAINTHLAPLGDRGKVLDLFTRHFTSLMCEDVIADHL